MVKWIIDNKEWIFSGIGGFIFSVLFAIFVKNKKPKNSNSMNQKGGKDSINYQANGNINIGTKDE